MMRVSPERKGAALAVAPGASDTCPDTFRLIFSRWMIDTTREALTAGDRPEDSR